LSMPISSSIFSVSSCTTFKVSWLILRALICFELIFVERDLGVRFSLLLVDLHFSQHHLLKRLPLNVEYVCFWLLCQKLDDCSYVGLFLGLLFYFICLCACVFVPVLYFVCSYRSIR
jgi:hypothetical protein